MQVLFTRMRTGWPWLAGAAGLLLLYALAGFFLVPRLARGAIEDFVAERLQRQVAIENLTFNPFTLAAEVTGFRLTEMDGRPLISFSDLLVNVQLSTLWNRAITFAEIRLVQPEIDAVINRAGELNLAALVPPAAKPEEPTVPATLPAIRIGLLEVDSGRVGLEDQTRSTPFRATITPIQFTLNDFRTTVDYQNAYRFAGTTQAGEQLEWSGQFSVQPLGSTGSFSIGALKASTLWAYVRDQVAFTLPSGTIDLNGTYNLAVGADNRVALDLALPGIRFSDFTVAPLEGDGTPWISLPLLALADTRFALGERRLTVGKVGVDGARITVVRETDGTLNLQRLAGSGAAPTAEVPVATNEPAASASPWQAEFAVVEVRNTTVEATDRGIEPAVTMSLSPIAITLTGVKSDLTQSFALNADVGINGLARLQVNGTLRPQSLLADIDVELTGFGVPALQPYIAAATTMTVESGQFGVKGHVTYAAEPVSPQPQLAFTGGIDLNGFASKDDFLKQDFLKFGLLSVTGIDYSMAPDRLTIQRILARDPYARVVISQDAKLNVTQVLNPEAESDLQPTAHTPQPGIANAMPVRINTIVVENGSADFADYSLEPSFATGIQSLAGTVQGLSSNESTRAKVDLKGAVDRFSPVVIAGEVNLLSAALYTDLAMSFSNMELTTFNPYSGKFAGYNIAKGKLTTELKYKVDNRQLEAEHHVVLDQLEFGAATDSKDAVPLPIKLAVALLKDRNGVIDINLPVRGSLDDPTFRLSPLIWKAVVGLLTKIVTAPFALLGSLFGGGEDLAFVDFTPGSAQLSAESAAKLGTLAKALVERPQLKLDIPLNVTTAVDAEAIAREALEQNVLAPATPAADEPGQLQQQLQALTLAHTRLVGTPPVTPTTESLPTQIDFVENALLARLAPTDIQLDALARSRAEAVQAALLGTGEIAPERVFLTTRDLATQAGGAVRMELKLE